MPRWKILLCCVAMTATASPIEPLVSWSTYLGVADCDDVALWQGDLFLACHSPESSLPVQVTESRGPQGMMAAYVLRLDLNEGKLVYATRVGSDAMTAALRIKTDEEGSCLRDRPGEGPWATGYGRCRAGAIRRRRE